MANQEVQISFKIDGIETTVKSVDQLKKEVAKLGTETKKATDEGTALGQLKTRFNNLIAPIKGVVNGMTTLKGAIVSTGIGALVVALGSLVAYFTSSEKGSKQLAIAMETLKILFKDLTDFAIGLGEKILAVFQDPKQALIDFGDLIKANIIERFESAIDVAGALASALIKVFKGDFKGALDDVKEAGSEFVDVLTGVDDTVNKVVTAAVEGFDRVKTAVNTAIAAADRLVTAMRGLRDQQQRLVVENAQLNKELETQKRIAEDTTLAYDERKAALEQVGQIQVKLAENLAAQAANEEKVLRLQIQQAATYEQREELETQLATAVAERINAETELEVIKLESAKITRELELEELERKRAINDILKELQVGNIEDEFARAQEELRIQEEAAMAELNLLKATEEEKLAVAKEFDKKQKKLVTDKAAFDKKVKTAELNTALQVTASAFNAISEIVGEQSIAGKAAAVAAATINTYQAATNALANTPAPPPFPAIAAGVAVAAGLLNIKKILAVETPGGGTVTAPNISAPSPTGVPTAPPRDPNAAIRDANALAGAGAAAGIGAQPAIRAYVIATEVSSEQEANQKIENLSKL